ncbi:MAG: aspartate aminotransferase family protein, partial [Actinomycetota bacterium]|nr:aspartate aminotransferase family protein [Actinomycetota bacterium]
MDRSYDAVLARASDHARAWLDSLPTRSVPAGATYDEVLAVLGGPLPDGPTDPVEVIDLLAKGVEPGLVAMGSGRFFGFVIGG